MATYTQLVSKVKDWANRSDISDDTVGDFLQYAAKNIYNVLRIPPLENIETVDITGNTFEINIPSDMIEVIRLRTYLTSDASKQTVQLFNNKVDSRSFVDTNSAYYRDLTFTRVGGTYRFSHEIEAGHTLELYYYRLLSELDAAYADTPANKGGLVPAGQTSATIDGVTVTATEASCNAVSGVFSSESCSVDSYPDSIVGVEAPNWLRDEAEEVLLYGALSELWGYFGDIQQEQKWKSKFEEKMAELMREELMRNTRGGSITQYVQTNGLI